MAAIAIACHFAAILACSSSPETRRQRYLESGNQYFNKGQYREALIEFRNAVQADGRSGEARLRLAQTYERIGDRSNASAEHVRAADLLPDDLALQVKAGNYLLSARRFDDAKARAEAVLAREPQNVPAKVLLGNASAGLNNLDQAVAEIEEAIRLDPKRGATYASLGAIEMTRGRNDAAEAAFKQALTLDPKFVPGYLALANHYWSTGRTTDAERELKHALAIDPANALANRALALLYLATNRASEAEAPAKSLATTGASPFALADFYLLQRRPADAIPELERLRGNAAIAQDAGRRLAQAYAYKGDRAGAHATVDALLKEDAKDAKNLLLKGQLLADDGKGDEALARFQSAAESDPNSAEIKYALGRALAQRGDLEGARRAFNDTLRLNPRAGSAQAELARLDLLGGHVNSAVQLAKDALSNEPGNVDAQITLLRGLVASRDFAAADRLLGVLLESHPKLAPLHVQRALLLVARKRSAEARDALEEALRYDAASVEAINGMVSLDSTAGNHAAARARIAAEIEKRPKLAELWVVSARSEIAARDLPAAERALRRATELDSTLLPAYALLGQVYAAQGKLAEARQQLETVVARQPKSVAALTMLGMIAQGSNDLTSARSYFERAIDVGGGAPVASNNLAWIYAERDENLERALVLAQSAAKALPKSAEVKDTLGWVQYKRKAFAEAAAAFESAVALAPENATYFYHLGLAAKDAGNAARARQALERALALNPALPSAADAKRVLGSLGTTAGSSR